MTFLSQSEFLVKYEYITSVNENDSREKYLYFERKDEERGENESDPFPLPPSPPPPPKHTNKEWKYLLKAVKHITLDSSRVKIVIFVCFMMLLLLLLLLLLFYDVVVVVVVLLLVVALQTFSCGSRSETTAACASANVEKNEKVSFHKCLWCCTCLNSTHGKIIPH